MIFLQVNRNSVTPAHKEKLPAYEKQIVNLINSNKPRKPIPQGQLNTQMLQQQPQPQITQVQSQENQMSPQLQSMNMQGSIPTLQQNNMGSSQHNNMTNLQQSSMSVIPTAQQNLMNPMQQPNSSIDTGQGNALNTLQQPAGGSLQQNTVSSQSANINNLSSQGGVNVLQPNVSPLHSNPNMLQHQHLKQQQEQQMLQTQQFKQLQQRQMQQQLMQKQHILQQQQQQHQLHQQAKQQLPSQLQTYQMSPIHQINEMNDIKMRQGLGVKPGVFQPSSAAQRPPYQQLKPGTSFPISSQLQSGSPQVLQHSSPQLDQQNVVSSITKAGTPLQSANSPFVAPSPSTPVVPSPMPGDSDKPISALTSHSNAGNVGHQAVTSAPAPGQSLAIGTPGISASPLLAEFSVPEGTHGSTFMPASSKSSITKQPIECLIEAVSCSKTLLTWIFLVTELL